MTMMWPRNETEVLEVQVNKEEALYIVIGTEDGWLEYNKKEYELAKKILASI